MITTVAVNQLPAAIGRKPWTATGYDPRAVGGGSLKGDDPMTGSIPAMLAILALVVLMNLYDRLREGVTQ